MSLEEDIMDEMVVPCIGAFIVTFLLLFFGTIIVNGFIFLISSI